MANIPLFFGSCENGGVSITLILDDSSDKIIAIDAVNTTSYDAIVYLDDKDYTIPAGYDDVISIPPGLQKKIQRILDEFGWPWETIFIFNK